jgi:hypothetical protein
VNVDDVEAWQHDLRNAANRAHLCATVAQRLLQQGESARAAAYVDDVLAACDRFSALLENTRITSVESMTD